MAHKLIRTNYSLTGSDVELEVDACIFDKFNPIAHTYTDINLLIDDINRHVRKSYNALAVTVREYLDTTRTRNALFFIETIIMFTNVTYISRIPFIDPNARKSKSARNSINVATSNKKSNSVSIRDKGISKPTVSTNGRRSAAPPRRSK